MPFIVQNLVHDLRTYGVGVAWYNVRFLVGVGILRSLIRDPLDVHVHDETCGLFE